MSSYSHDRRSLCLRTLILAMPLMILASCSGGGIEDQPFYNPSKYHHTAEGFRNPPDSPERIRRPGRFFSFLWKRFTEDTAVIELPEGHVLPTREVKKQLAAAPKDARITWIGHATFLIGLNGLNILTDPHFTERSSPFSFAGPKRYAQPGLAIQDLPPIDVILISHNHYDSFDEDSLRALAKHSPKARILTPLGLEVTTKEWGFTNTRDMDWFDTDKVGEVTFVATPAVHRANRWLFDVNETLWTGFTIEAGGKKIWFVGDTGMGPMFERDLVKKISPVDITLAPAGAFLPRGVMRAVHTTPEEGLELARMMGSKTAIAMHWGTFPLGSDNPLQGQARFMGAPDNGVKKVMMRIGETRSLRDMW
jgi:N-acyl-phosphatidylethanolamine-hydrolysing phospholipase D